MISKACTIICTIECWTSKGKQYGLEFVQVKVNKTYKVEPEQFCVQIENQYHFRACFKWELVSDIALGTIIS